MIDLRKVFAFSLALALAASVPVRAEDKHEHGAGADHHEAGAAHKDEKPHFDKPEFGNVKDAWAFITTKAAEVEKLLAANTIEPVHKIAEQMEVAVHTLEEKSDMVADANKTNLSAALKQFDKAADELHHAGEDKNADAATLSLQKLKGLMPVIEGLYPAGALK